MVLEHSKLTCWFRACLKGINIIASGLASFLEGPAKVKPASAPPLLSSKVPLCACSLCSTRECLYMLSSHDIEQCPVYRDLPPSRVGRSPEPSQGTGAFQDPRGTAQACKEYLRQIQSCLTLQDQMVKMREIVGWMPLMAAQKNFFWEALDVLQKAASGSGPGTSNPES